MSKKDALPAQSGSLDLLLTRIIDDAETEAKVILAKAEEDIQAVEAKAKTKVESLESAHAKEKTALTVDIMERAQTNAKLEGRKQALEKRRGLIATAYTLAFEKLTKLDGDKRKNMLEALLNRECEGGETLRPATADRALLTEILGVLNERLVNGLKPRIELGGDVESAGGFIIVTTRYEKNCTFEALIDYAREAFERDVANILFG